MHERDRQADRRTDRPQNGIIDTNRRNRFQRHRLKPKNMIIAAHIGLHSEDVLQIKEYHSFYFFCFNYAQI